MDKMKLMALGNDWRCIGEPTNKTEKKIKKNVETLQRQHFLNAAKGLVELGLISLRDYDEIKRTTLKKGNH